MRSEVKPIVLNNTSELLVYPLGLYPSMLYRKQPGQVWIMSQNERADRQTSSKDSTIFVQNHSPHL